MNYILPSWIVISQSCWHGDVYTQSDAHQRQFGLGIKFEWFCLLNWHFSYIGDEYADLVLSSISIFVCFSVFWETDMGQGSSRSTS